MSTVPPHAENSEPGSPAGPKSSAGPKGRAPGTNDALSKGADSLRALKMSGFVFALGAGWGFILWANKFHFTAAAMIVCLGYLAILATILNLWRTGAAVAERDDPMTDAWDRPVGPQAELEKQKRTLLKAIKEAEFDFAMGKLSQADSEALIHGYRVRAIEVIKELDQQIAGVAMSPRDQIHREVAARLALAKRTGEPKIPKGKENRPSDPGSEGVTTAAAQSENAVQESK